MAHPTIDLTSSPDADCPNSAYNCVKYCFQANDFQTEAGVKATFEIQFNPGAGSYIPPATFEIAGQLFNAGTQTTYNEIDTLGPYTLLQMAEAFKASLLANNYINTNFEIEIVGTDIIATAREEGELQDFTFDTSGTLSPPTFVFTNGSLASYRNNYRLIVELWECNIDPVTGMGTTLKTLIAREAYIPQSNGEFCINLGAKIAPLLETSFPFSAFLSGTTSSFFFDTTIAKTIAINYGESYSDDLEQCNVELRTFEKSECVTVVNSAFQRENQQDKILQMCEDEFLTSMPQYTEFCPDSLVFLWFYYLRVFELIINPITDKLRPYVVITYTDGTTDTGVGTEIGNPGDSDGFIAVTAQLDSFALFIDPAKTVKMWEVRIVFRQNNDPLTDQYFGSQIFQAIDCCEDSVEFYFLNEFGAYDTILFNNIQSINLEQEFSIKESFTDCSENDALQSGKDIIAQSAFDIYTVVSKFANTYENRLWIRQFMMSPKKYVRGNILQQDDIFHKAIVLDTSTLYFSRDDSSLFFQLQFRINEDLNIQNN